MQPTLHPADTYLLVLTRRDAAELLLVPNGSGWTLPRVDVQPHRRIAPQLASAARTIWGVEAFCSFIPSLSARGRVGELKCAVMEAVGQNNGRPAENLWVPRSTVEARLEASEAAMVRGTYDQLDDYAKDYGPGNFAKPGWLGELYEWTQVQIDGWNLKLTGRFDQLNASPTFSLIRMETNGVAVWFKATGEPNTREISVTTTLARLFPASLPNILAIHQKWNGWLSEEIIGKSLDEVTDLGAWEQAAEQFAELQIASIARTADLLKSNLKDLRIPKLVKRVDPFLERMRELMAAQTKATPAPLTNPEFEELSDTLKESCRRLQEDGLPDALGHIDLNPGNVLLSRNGPVFLDWAEGCVTHPLLPIHYLCEHLTRTGFERTPAVDHLTAAYLRPWASLYAPKDLNRIMSFASLVAVFAYAVATDSWRSLDAVHNPGLAPYFRSLTRRMHREMRRISERSELCFS